MKVQLEGIASPGFPCEVVEGFPWLEVTGPGRWASLLSFPLLLVAVAMALSMVVSLCTSSWINLCKHSCIYPTWVCSLFLSGLWVILFVSQCLFPPHFMSRYGITHVFNHFNSHEGKIASCFNLYFFDYYWVWTSVHMLIGHLHISVNCLLIFFAHFSFGWSLSFSIHIMSGIFSPIIFPNGLLLL